MGLVDNYLISSDKSSKPLRQETWKEALNCVYVKPLRNKPQTESNKQPQP